MLSDLKRLRSESGPVVVSAVMVIAIMTPIGLALLAIVDTQARQSGIERTRDRASSPLAYARRGWCGIGSVAFALIGAHFVDVRQPAPPTIRARDRDRARSR